MQRANAEQVIDRTEALADDIAAREYELRLVRLMRPQLPAADFDGPIVFVGQAELVRELVGGTLKNVTSELSELADVQRLHDGANRCQLIEAAEAACGADLRRLRRSPADVALVPACRRTQ